MNICLYTGSALPKLGGQEAVVDALARQFLTQGHEPTVLAPMPRLPMWPCDQQYPYRVIRHPRFYSTRYFVNWYRGFVSRAARKHRFDVIHCHDVYPTGYVAVLSRDELKIPLVITSHGGDVRAGNARLRKPGMRPRFEQAIRSADALISIGRFTTEGFLQLGADATKIHDIPNGVDLTPFAAPVHRPPDLSDEIHPGAYLLFIGRLARRKGLDVLLNALALLPRAAGIELVIAGSGDEQESIEQLIQQLRLTDRVKLVGRVEGAKKTWLLQNATAVVLPSRGWEAFPLVVLEAYAAGRPVVGSRIAGLEDVIIPEQTGLLFESESHEELATALRRVRDDAGWLQQAGANARARAEDYSWDEIARRHVDMYTGLRQSR
jgi:glycosyltransferase involved in cell wall biosynthesis